MVRRFNSVLKILKKFFYLGVDHVKTYQNPKYQVSKWPEAEELTVYVKEVKVSAPL